jgi:hypothetical protein
VRQVRAFLFPQFVLAQDWGHKRMKTKIPSAFAALVLSVAIPATAQTTQYFTVQAGGSLPVQTNQLVSVIGYDYSSRPPISAAFPNGTFIILSPLANYQASVPNMGGNFTTTSAAALPQQAITGATNIYVSFGQQYGNGNVDWATFQVTTPACANVVSNYVPADAIVIPASVSGNVQIILESSPDLVNWTAASPGTYGASAGTNRFFRVRAAVNP